MIDVTTAGGGIGGAFSDSGDSTAFVSIDCGCTISLSGYSGAST